MWLVLQYQSISHNSHLTRTKLYTEAFKNKNNKLENTVSQKIVQMTRNIVIAIAKL